MRPGQTTTYINDRLANLLDEHGPHLLSDDGKRQLAEKLNYLVAAWDAILRDEKARWKALLSRDEWEVVLQCCWSHAFAMEQGGPYEADLSGAILACVQDTLPSDITLDGADVLLASTAAKLRDATVAAQFALAWMVIRERIRRGK